MPTTITLHIEELENLNRRLDTVEGLLRDILGSMSHPTPISTEGTRPRRVRRSAPANPAEVAPSTVGEPPPSSEPQGWTSTSAETPTTAPVPEATTTEETAPISPNTPSDGATDDVRPSPAPSPSPQVLTPSQQHTTPDARIAFVRNIPGIIPANLPAILSSFGVLRIRDLSDEQFDLLVARLTA